MPSRKLNHNIKDDTTVNSEHDLVYFSRCLFTTCADIYVGEAVKRCERVVDHAGRDMRLHIVRHCLHPDQ